MQKEPKNICPACHSWNKDAKEEYKVTYKGLKGKCLTPICKAEWTIKTPEK